MWIAACRLKYYLHYSLLFLLYTNELSSEVIEADHVILNSK